MPEDQLPDGGCCRRGLATGPSGAGEAPAAGPHGATSAPDCPDQPML